MDDSAELFTEEERNLLDTPDDEIISRNKKFSFDVKEFDARISSGDAWQRIVQGQLYFEHAVCQLLLESLKNPEAISLSRMGHSQRLDLASALGILDDEILRALKKINSLRNHLAHSLNFDITDKDVADLANCTSPGIRKLLQSEKSSDDRQLGLYDLLMANMVLLEGQRQQNAASREIRKKALLMVKEAAAHYRQVRNRECLDKPNP